MAQTLGVAGRRGTRDNRLTVAVAGTAMAVGSGIGIAFGLGAAAFPTLVDRHSPLPFNVSGGVMVAIHVVALLAIARLAAANVSGQGVFPRVAYGIALLGLALQVVAEGLLRVNYDGGSALFGIVSPLLGLGMILVGIAIIRGRVWTGWERFAPLLCGAYVFVVLAPAFAITRGPNFIALAGYSACYMLLGLAMRRHQAA
jgi:hypothetical protein